MTIVDRALQLISRDATVGLGSGRAAQAFVRALGARIREQELAVRGVATSLETAELARQVGITLASLEEVGQLDAAIDGADEVDPELNLIKGYGRALVREKIVAASAKRLVILVGEEKLVPKLGSRGKLPVEVVPFAVPLCQRRFTEMGLRPSVHHKDGGLFLSDNGNAIIDCSIGPIDDPANLERWIRSVPGVVDTGLFLGMADIVLVGGSDDMQLKDEVRKQTKRAPAP